MNYHELAGDQLLNIKTLGELKQAGYQPKDIKSELRDNLIRRIRSGQNVFPGIWGYEDTVVPDLERAILARHNICLLGLRGQAKTRLARQMASLLDDYVPVIQDSELNEDPLSPISAHGKHIVETKGDHTPIGWMSRDQRYTEKLATPDVSIADLIGDVDPIKAASLKLPYSDPRVIHYGLVPRSHRGIFAINELPDLQARIQVALFNILQEGDIQIRGFKLRLPLDILFVFTANPEDYTNRGSIVTPLKDRIDSQVITHYPKSIEIGKQITQQESRVDEDQKNLVMMNVIAQDLVEQIAVEARKSEYVDEKSGVSARLTISAYEGLWSAAERRALREGETPTSIRISDFVGVVPAITGKVELVYEGEQEGAGLVAHNLIGKAIREQFVNYFPNPDEFRKKKEENPFQSIINWFGDGNTLDMMNDYGDSQYHKALDSVPGLCALVEKYQSNSSQSERYFLMEFALHGLAEYSMLSKNPLVSGLQFKDLLSGMFTMPDLDEDDLDDF
jgi:magnesium chelatase subunit I